jgi:hypothetical protein
MNEFERLTKMLGEAQEALEMLAGGEAGMLDEGTTDADIAELITAVQEMASFLEDEIGSRRLSRVDDSEIENTVDCWLDTAAKVDARRGEVA